MVPPLRGLADSRIAATDPNEAATGRTEVLLHSFITFTFWKRRYVVEGFLPLNKDPLGTSPSLECQAVVSPPPPPQFPPQWRASTLLAMFVQCLLTPANVLGTFIPGMCVDREIKPSIFFELLHTSINSYLGTWVILVIMIMIIIMITMTISPQDCFTFVLFADALDGKFPLEMIEIKKKTWKKFQKYIISIDSVFKLYTRFPYFPFFKGASFFPLAFPFLSLPLSSVLKDQAMGNVSNIETCSENFQQLCKGRFVEWGTVKPIADTLMDFLVEILIW